MNTFHYDGVSVNMFFSLFFLLIVFAPIFEEVSFRLFLIRSQRNLKIGFSFFLSGVVFKLINHFVYLNVFVDYCAQLLLAVSIFLLIGYFNVGRYFLVIKSLSQDILLLISSILFGLFHIGIYYNSEIYVFQFVAVLGHMASGYIFGKFRIKYGIVNSIKLHVSINTIAFIAITT